MYSSLSLYLDIQENFSHAKMVNENNEPFDDSSKQQKIQAYIFIVNALNVPFWMRFLFFWRLS